MDSIAPTEREDYESQQECYARVTSCWKILLPLCWWQWGCEQDRWKSVCHLSVLHDGAHTEALCFVGCAPGKFNCTNTVCIDSTKKCDASDDCGDKSDEDATLCAHYLRYDFEGALSDFTEGVTGKEDQTDWERGAGKALSVPSHCWCFSQPFFGLQA